jgi:hypothetical protein
MPKPQAKHPALVVKGKWQNVFSQPETKATLESILSDYLYTLDCLRNYFERVMVLPEPELNNRPNLVDIPQRAATTVARVVSIE